MKKYILAAIAALTLISLVSCGDDMVESDGNRMTDDARADIRDMENGAERAADDLTDGSTMDMDYNNNVDDYNPYGPEAK